MVKHKRGGAYKLRIMTDVTNWSGVLLDREILNYLQVEDIVRVIFEPYNDPRYIQITDILPNGYFKGCISENGGYNVRYCDICREEGIANQGKPLYRCSNICEFDCHLECLKKNPNKKCNCETDELKIEMWPQYLMNGSKIIFKKNNISEIPNWTNNTTKLIETYRNSKNLGYMLTGGR